MALSVTIELPDQIEERLLAKYGSLDQVATEALLIDLFRRGELTEAQLARALGIPRLEVDGVLKSHGVMLELSDEEFAADLTELRGIVRK